MGEARGDKEAAGGAINVHHHFLPKSYMRAIGDRLPPGRGTRRAAEWTPAVDIDAMDANGVARSIGSISMPGCWFGDVGESRRLAREWNEGAAAIARDHPARFGFFAAIAPPDVDGSLSEIAHALDTLGADGVALMTSYDGRHLGDAAFRPVLAELDRRGAIVFVHPGSVGEEQTPKGVKAHVLEGPFDTTRSIASLLVSGALTEFTRAKFVFAHAGGAMPFLAGRLASLAGGEGHMSPARVREQLGTLWFDTALSINAPAMAALTAFASPSKILFGTDSPILPLDVEMAAWRGLALDEATRARIERSNVVELFATKGAR